MLPTPEEGLRILGARFRAARLARGLTQRGAAAEARVNRGHLALLERGGNVSVRFLLKVGRYLGIPDISLAEGNADAMRGMEVTGLLDVGDALEVLAGFVRDLAVEASLPPSERGELTDTPPIRSFVERRASQAELARLGDLFRSAEIPRQGRPATPTTLTEDANESSRRRAK